jgi:hypothetical protein
MEGGITEKYQYLDNCETIILPEMGGAIPYSNRGEEETKMILCPEEATIKVTTCRYSLSVKWSIPLFHSINHS